MIISIVAFIVILGPLIIIHEAGHFLMAKRLGVRVLRFSMGFPPRIFGIRRGETEYVIGATPIGGYVRMLGDEVGEEPKSDDLHTFLVEIEHDLVGAARATGALDAVASAHAALAVGHDVAAGERPSPADNDEDATLYNLACRLATGDSAQALTVLGRALKPEESLFLNRIRLAGSAEKALTSLRANPPDELLGAFRACAFPTQRLWKRVAIVLAGPASNILLAPILLTILFMYGVPTPLPVVGQVQAGLPAAMAGLQTGDNIIAVNGKRTPTWDDFSDAVKASKGAPVTLEVERPQGGSPAHERLTITPRREQQKTIYGTMASDWIIGVMSRGDESTRRFNPVSAAYHAVIMTGSMTAQMVIGIASIISGKIPLRENVGGPIMIAQLAGHVAHQGFASVLLFTVMLSLNLGIMNLLPMPVLDGGQLAFFVFEGLRGKPLATRHREIALQVGLFLLVAVLAFFIFNDISRIVQG
ncbi:MAG TPA: RIP metalloprotease RseP [Candidatus Binataceae bacterium]|nr:RIP metalloprotease RseP [Candidatus Binataceae bacterium]